MRKTDKVRTFRHRGFTLIELLVVVAIICILLSVMVPTLSRIKSIVRGNLCASNEHQLALGMTSYATAWRGYMPRQDYPGTGRNLWDVSNDFLNILKSRYQVPHSMFFCPSGPPDLPKPGGYDYYGYFTLMGYMLWVPKLNGGVQIPPDTGVIPGDLVRGPVAQQDSRAEALLNPIFTDLVGTVMSCDYNGDLSREGVRLGLDARSNHLEGSNLWYTNQAFIDGHVDTVPGSVPKCRYGGNWWNWR